MGGHEIGHRLTNASTREECCAACKAEERCTAWVRQPSTGFCFLCEGTGSSGTKPAEDREIGFKAPGPSWKYAVRCDAASMRLTAEEPPPAPFNWPLVGSPV